MKRFKNILYVADSSGDVLKAFRHAVGLAERNSARLTVIRVMERTPPHLTRLMPHMLRQIRAREPEAALGRLSEQSAGRVEVETKIVEGKAFLEIIREVLRNARDLVIKSAGSDGGARGWLFGTTDLHLIRKCPCPVWLIKSTDPAPIRRVMACVDFNDLDPPGQDTAEPLNRMILELAGSLAVLERAEFHVAHAWEAIGEHVMRNERAGFDEEEVDSYVGEVCLKHRDWLNRLLYEARTWIRSEKSQAIKPKTHLPKGDPSEVIPRLARTLRADLIVMGTVARTGIPGLIIGNTAESILSDIDCSLLAVKPEGFVTPIRREK
ncbi:MAG: universal stress protein [bacterium]|nr:universal stress protein [bacterium]